MSKTMEQKGQIGGKQLQQSVNPKPNLLGRLNQTLY
jgi:hypothetical protein